MAALILIASAGPAGAFPQQSCGDQSCQDCHFLTRDEAMQLLGDRVETVQEVGYSELPGLFEVIVSKAGKKLPVYIDFSKSFVVSGEIIRLDTLENLTSKRYYSLNKVDVSRIPVDDAVVLGNPAARWKIIVFDDPECPFCQRLFEEMKQVVAKRPDVAFLIKMFPLKIHPGAADKARAIICAKSVKMLEDSLAGKPVPAPSCKTFKVEENTALAQTLGIGSVPTLIYPDGMVVPGFTKAEAILQLLEEARAGLPAGSGK